MEGVEKTRRLGLKWLFPYIHLQPQRRDTTIDQYTKTEQEDRGGTDSLTDLIRTGAQQLLAQALKAEVADLLASYADQRDEQGHARVVLSGHHPKRDIQTGIGPVTVRVPKVRSRQGTPVTFHSALVPPYVRKTASLEAAIPWLYLKGISTGEMQPSPGSSRGPRGQRAFRQYGGSAQAALARGVCHLAATST